MSLVKYLVVYYSESFVMMDVKTYVKVEWEEEWNPTLLTE